MVANMEGIENVHKSIWTVVNRQAKNGYANQHIRMARKYGDMRRALVGIDDAMHETVSLPGSHHFCVTLGNVKEESFTPRFTLRYVQLEDTLRNPFAQDAEAVPMGLLLANAAKCKGGTIESLEAAYADEGRGDAGENAGVLQFLARDGQIRQRYQSEGASGWDGEGVHGYGVLSTLRA